MSNFPELWPFIQTVVIFGGGVWAVADIKGTTRVLSHAIDNLSGRIDDLKEWMGSIQEKHNDHSERIAKLEADQLNGHRRRANGRQSD